MDYIMIGPYQFDRDASKDDMRLDYCSSFQEVALDESSLSFDTVSVEVCTTTIGAQLSALPNNTPIIVYRGGEIKARFVSSGVSRIGPVTYQLTGRSPMGALTGMVHTGGIYTGQIVEDVVKEICGNIPSLIKSVYAGVKLYGWLPYADGKERSARDNLAQVLFAIGAYLRTDLNGVLRIEPLWDGTASLIDVDRSYAGGTVKYDSPISAVTVTEHQYVAGTEVKDLFSGTAQNGDIITFSEPMHSLSATGFTILESGANYAKISAGTGALTGKAYIHNTRLITQPVTAGAVENIKSVTDATLVSLVNSYAVAKRLADYYRCRETITNNIVSGHEKPGHVVSVYHPYDKKMVSACIRSLDTTMSATLKSSMEALVGFTPAQPESAEYFDSMEILTGSGEWEVPPGVTGYTRVLIGGGDGGWSGLNGANSPSLHEETLTESNSDDRTRYVFIPYSEGGAGGNAGAPGAGGKVLVETIVDAVPGTKIPYNCGKGGAGGIRSASGSSQGAAGGATTMGGSSSAKGTSTDEGYSDSGTGQIFATPGAAGIPGSKGHGYSRKNKTYVDSPSPEIVVDGIVYKPGEDNDASDEGGRGNFATEPYGYVGWEWDGGFGGGAAYGANGGKGVANGHGSASKTSASVTGSSGGRGADALPPPKATTQYGKGGAGGNGGGGAGSNGTAIAKQVIKIGLSVSNASLLATNPAPGLGGNGSNGGEGGDGCIILYYRKFGQVKAGPLVQRGGGLFFDRLNKLFIV